MLPRRRVRFLIFLKSTSMTRDSNYTKLLQFDKRHDLVVVAREFFRCLLHHPGGQTTTPVEHPFSER